MAKKHKINKDNSKHIEQNEKIKRELNIKQRPDLTENQKKLINLALDKNTKIIFIKGPAGTSKTYTAILAALLLLNSKRISDIHYVRSIVESSDNKMGFLKGDENEKMAPYIQPLLDKLDELLPAQDINYLINEGRVKGFPIGFLRGLSWNAKAIIADECQNFSFKEIVTLITRIGEFSRFFLLADPKQSDIHKSGYMQIYTAFNTEESRNKGIYCVELTEKDIVRSEILKYIVSVIENINILSN